MFIGYVNKLISKFGHLQPDVLINLFNTYCCSFNGSSLWHLHSSGFKSCLTAWNIGARKVLIRGVPAIEIIFFILRNMTYMDMLCIALYEPKYKYTLHFYV